MLRFGSKGFSAHLGVNTRKVEISLGHHTSDLTPRARGLSSKDDMIGFASINFMTFMSISALEIFVVGSWVLYGLLIINHWFLQVSP